MAYFSIFQLHWVSSSLQGFSECSFKFPPLVDGNWDVFFAGTSSWPNDLLHNFIEADQFTEYRKAECWWLNVSLTLCGTNWATAGGDGHWVWVCRQHSCGWTHTVAAPHCVVGFHSHWPPFITRMNQWPFRSLLNVWHTPDLNSIHSIMFQCWGLLWFDKKFS